MKILITGATGLIGQKLVTHLISQGYEINYLTTHKSKIKLSNSLNGFYWNLKSNYIDKTCFNGVDTIINLCGSSISSRWNKSNKHEILNSRVESLKLIKNTIVEYNISIKQLISASAIGIYPSSKDVTYDEKYINKSQSFLGKVVFQWELAANSFKDLNINVSLVRIGLVLTKKGGILEKTTFPIKFGFGSVFGDGLQWQSWIHIDDLIKIFNFILINNLTGIYNATSSNPVTNIDFTKTVAKILQRPLIFPNIQKWMLSFILGEMHILIFESQKVSNSKLINMGFVFSYSNFESAVKDLLN